VESMIINISLNLFSIFRLYTLQKIRVNDEASTDEFRFVTWLSSHLDGAELWERRRQKQQLPGNNQIRQGQITASQYSRHVRHTTASSSSAAAVSDGSWLAFRFICGRVAGCGIAAIGAGTRLTGGTMQQWQPCGPVWTFTAFDDDQLQHMPPTLVRLRVVVDVVSDRRRWRRSWRTATNAGVRRGEEGTDAETPAAVGQRGGGGNRCERPGESAAAAGEQRARAPENALAQRRVRRTARRHPAYRHDRRRPTTVQDRDADAG